MKEVQARMRDAAIVLQRLHIFWRKSNTSFKIKLIVLQAVLFAKILYGLESAELTDAARTKLDQFHFRALRKS